MPEAKIVSTENGPNLMMVDGKMKGAFCRCGQSSHKPMCDGSHAKVGFKAPKVETVILP